MSVRVSSLSSAEGELFSIRVSVEPKALEDLLEALATLPFPVNPQLYHGNPTVVEFPAYAPHLGAISGYLARAGFQDMVARPTLVSITAA